MSLCDDNFNSVSAERCILDIVWPFFLIATRLVQPDYNRDGTEVQISNNGKDYIRVWSFDDTEGALAAEMATQSSVPGQVH